MVTSYSPEGFFPVQMALCKEQCLPEVEQVATGTLFEASRVPTAWERSKVQGEHNTSPSESVLGEQEKGRGPFQLGIEAFYEESGI